MPALNNLPSASRLSSTDIMLRDVSSGNDARKIPASQMATDLLGMVSPQMHRNIYRGKNLGTSVTAEQKSAIQNGTFDDLFIGDYWTIGGDQYDIADMDYWNMSVHHLVMVPHIPIGTAKMNDTATTAGAYVGSKMYTDNLDSVKSTISSAFGSDLLSHQACFANAMTSGYPTGYVWVSSTVDLMSEVMVYGTRHYSTMPNGSVDMAQATIDKSQLSLFRLNPASINGGGRNYWLRDVANGTQFAAMDASGMAFKYSAAYALGVRPCFAVGVSS